MNNKYFKCCGDKANVVRMGSTLFELIRTYTSDIVPSGLPLIQSSNYGLNMLMNGKNGPKEFDLMLCIKVK